MTNNIHNHRYNILYQGKVIHQNLEESEYFDIIEDLASEFYANGSPSPHEIKTEIVKGD